MTIRSKGILGIVCMVAVAAVVFAEGTASSINHSSGKVFSSPAAEQSYMCQGDMSRNVTDSQMVSLIKNGKPSENFTRTASCTTSCTANCTTSCSTCCSHQCGRGY